MMYGMYGCMAHVWDVWDCMAVVWAASSVFTDCFTVSLTPASLGTRSASREMGIWQMRPYSCTVRDVPDCHLRGNLAAALRTYYLGSTLYLGSQCPNVASSELSARAGGRRHDRRGLAEQERGELHEGGRAALLLREVRLSLFSRVRAPNGCRLPALFYIHDYSTQQLQSSLATHRRRRTGTPTRVAHSHTHALRRLRLARYAALLHCPQANRRQ